MDTSGRPPKSGMIPMCKAMLAFLPEANARALLPMLHLMEIRELLARFQWEDAHLLCHGQSQEPMTMERVFDMMKDSLDPETMSQLESMQQMFEMMNAMKDMDNGDVNGDSDDPGFFADWNGDSENGL